MSGQNRSIQVLGISLITLAPVDRLRLTVLVEDSLSAEKPNLTAKHGLFLR